MSYNNRLQANNAELQEILDMANSLPDAGEGGQATPTQEKSIDIATNGSYEVTPDEGYALSKVTANVTIPSDKKPEQEKSIEITENGTTEVTPDDGKVLNKVSVTVYVPEKVPSLQEKSVTPQASSQEVVADNGYDGLSKVTVGGDANLKAENIKKDVSIFGVTGTHEGGEDLDAVIAEQAELIEELSAALDGKAIGGGGASEPVLQEKSVTPTKSAQTVVADSGYDGLSKVNVGAIPSQYIEPSGTKAITANGTHDVKSYASVSVSVPTSGGGSTGENKLAQVMGFSVTSLASDDFGGATYIRNNFFSNCKQLESVTIPDSVTKIYQSAFHGCSGLPSIIIPNSVTVLDYLVFYGCTSLTYVKVSKNITEIKSQTFAQCTKMATFDFSENTFIPKLGDVDAFYQIPSTCQIKVPAALYSQWISATNWSTYADNIVSVGGSNGGSED